MRPSSAITILPSVLLVLALLAACGAPVEPVSFDEARAAARESNRPLLVDFYTDWCEVCEQFAAAAESDETVKDALSRVVLYKVDAEKGEGVELAERYSVEAYPTFVLTDADGREIERFWGFDSPAGFSELLAGATADPSTVEEKIARFASAPDAKTAATLGRVMIARGSYAEGVEYYRRARELDPAAAATHDEKIFWATYYGLDEPFTVDQLREAAEAMFVRADTAALPAARAALALCRTAAKRKAPELREGFLARAMERTAGSEDEKVLEIRELLEIEYTLHVEKDVDRAVALKRAAMPDGWEQDAEALNEFAWWSFENAINLEEAERLATRAVELAEAGSQKAMILDTLAEICNVRGDCKRSLELIEQAIAEDPDNEYYATQRKRFEDLLARRFAL